MSELQIETLKRGWLQHATRLVQVSNPAGKFEITDRNREIVAGIFYWFLNDERSCYDLNKGILLTGGMGTGKTTLIKAFRNFFQSFKQSFKLESAMRISKEFVDSGSYDRYCLPHLLAIDEVGRETLARHYGNAVNVIGVILHERYDLWLNQAIPTIITTNLDAYEIETIYGDIIRDRAKEMFNWVILDGESRR